jgi:hypothetical protein
MERAANGVETSARNRATAIGPGRHITRSHAVGRARFHHPSTVATIHLATDAEAPKRCYPPAGASHALAHHPGDRPERLGHGFRWLVAANIVDNFGDGVVLAAGPLLVASLTQDPFLVSLAVTSGFLPVLLFGLPGGAVADRVDRKRMVVLANIARAAVLGHPGRDDRQRTRSASRSSSPRCSCWARPRRSPTARAARSYRASSRRTTWASRTPGCRAGSC